MDAIRLAYVLVVSADSSLHASLIQSFLVASVRPLAAGRGGIPIGSFCSGEIVDVKRTTDRVAYRRINQKRQRAQISERQIQRQREQTQTNTTRDQRRETREWIRQRRTMSQSPAVIIYCFHHVTSPRSRDRSCRRRAHR